MVLQSLIARVSDGLILATSVEGADDVSFSFVFVQLIFLQISARHGSIHNAGKKAVS
jgi:hypothetical protein